MHPVLWGCDLRHSLDLQRLLSAARHVEAVSWAAGYVDNNRRIHKVVYIIGVTLSLLRLCGRLLSALACPFLDADIRTR